MPWDKYLFCFTLSSLPFHHHLKRSTKLSNQSLRREMIDLFQKHIVGKFNSKTKQLADRRYHSDWKKNSNHCHYQYSNWLFLLFFCLCYLRASSPITIHTEKYCIRQNNLYHLPCKTSLANLLITYTAFAELVSKAFIFNFNFAQLSICDLSDNFCPKMYSIY